MLFWPGPPRRPHLASGAAVINNPLRQLIEIYQVSVSEAFTAFLDSGLCDAPTSRVNWAANGIPHKGEIASGGTYQKLAYGLHINRNGQSVEFDFGKAGEIHEFDAFRLSQFWNENNTRSTFSYARDIEAAFNDAISNKTVRPTAAKHFELVDPLAGDNTPSSTTDSEATMAPPAYGSGDATYQAAGQEAGVRQLVDAFYNIMGSSTAYRSIWDMHPNDKPNDREVSRDKLARFLCAWMGGPRLYKEKYGAISIPGVHAHLAITATEHDQWLACMSEALERQPYSADFRGYLLKQLAIPAGRIVIACKPK